MQKNTLQLRDKGGTKECFQVGFREFQLAGFVLGALRVGTRKTHASVRLNTISPRLFAKDMSVRCTFVVWMATIATMISVRCTFAYIRWFKYYK